MGDRVIVEFGVGSPQLGEVIAVSGQHKMITVRLSEGILGQGDMPLQWNSDADVATALRLSRVRSARRVLALDLFRQYERNSHEDAATRLRREAHLLCRHWLCAAGG